MLALGRYFPAESFAVARRRGKAAGAQLGDREQAAQWMKLGYNVISFSSDIAVYRTALTEAVADLGTLAADK